MEFVPDFESARDKLANTQLIAPAYFILGGTNPGEVIRLNSLFICQIREERTTYI